MAMHHRSSSGGPAEDRGLLGLPTGTGGFAYGGGGGARGVGGASQAQDEALLERHNDEKLEELSRTVAGIKGVSYDIEGGIQESNTILDQLSGQMDDVQAMLGGAMDRIKTLSHTSSTKTMCMLVAFAVFIFVLLYYLVR
jgi:t-SNARE complex subunit (syntaxin)